MSQETISIIIKTIIDNVLAYILASPHDHQLNPEEQVIQTFENHFISNLHECDRQVLLIDKKI